MTDTGGFFLLPQLKVKTKHQYRHFSMWLQLMEVVYCTQNLTHSTAGDAQLNSIEHFYTGFGIFRQVTQTYTCSVDEALS